MIHSINKDRSAALPQIGNTDISWMRGKLHKYYLKDGRALSWRDEANPYLTLNTEIILQRTKAEDVEKHWIGIKKHLSSPEKALDAERFLQRLFEELGLLKRKDWILQAARSIQDRGKTPNSLKELQSLHGVGCYSSCATLAFAFNENEGLVDANIMRLFERFWGEYPHHDPRPKIRFWLPVSQSVGGKRAFKEVFWGLLDLSAKVCKPRTPICKECCLCCRCKTGLGRITVGD